MLHLLPVNREGELAGDFARRQARFFALGAVLMLLLSIWSVHLGEALARYLETMALDSFRGWMIVVAWGLALAFFPVLCAVCFLRALWHWHHSVWLPKAQAAPKMDRWLVVQSVTASFLPALTMLAMAVRGLIAGTVRWPHPKREYILATDPVPYWQSIGFFLIAAVVMAWPMWRYWQIRLGRDRADKAQPNEKRLAEKE